ncbi:MAG: protoporphyrinogen oxidase HemJ [Ostreibacterium sp.]
MMMLWVKVFHIIFVISWFAALFYLPRLFVYHATAEADLGNDASQSSAISHFKVMERKLYRGIAMPAMVATWITGVWLLYYFWPVYHGMGWLHAKLTLVILLTIYHFSMGFYYKKLRDGKNQHSHVFYRYYNEVPTILLLGIVILVVIKPF